MIVQFARSRKYCVCITLLVAFHFISALNCKLSWSAQVSLAWDRNVEPNIAGYKIHYGQSSNDYQYSVNVGNFTSATISGLTEGQVYYFAATAYDSVGNESGFSEEILYSVPVEDNSGQSSSDTIYEDAEDGNTSGWDVYIDDSDGAEITNVFDSNRQSYVIQLSGSGYFNGYHLKNADGSNWQNTDQFIIEWSMKYSEYFYIYVDVQTDQGQRYITYTPDNYHLLGGDRYAHHGLGSNIINGQWHTVIRDLQADLHDAQPYVNIIEVNGFLICGSGKVDDIKLLKRD